MGGERGGGFGKVLGKILEFGGLGRGLGVWGEVWGFGERTGGLWWVGMVWWCRGCIDGW